MSKFLKSLFVRGREKGTHPFPLPPEILETIVSQLSPPDLYRVIRVCRACREVVEPFLYAHLPLAKYPQRALRCCATLLARHDLARAVVSFSAETASPWNRVNLAHPLESIQITALREASGLKYLDLGCIPILALDILNHCTFQLKHLAWETVDCHPILHTFLERQPSIQSLALTSLESFTGLQPLHVPHLRSFCGHASLAAQIIPGRPVETVVIKGDPIYPDLLDALQKMGASKSPVRVLELYSTGLNLGTSREWSTPRGFFLELTSALPQLRKLKIMLRNEGQGDLINALTETINHFIGDLGDLRCFSIKTDIESFPMYSSHLSEQQEVELCQSWQKSCPRLVEVEYLSARRWQFINGQWERVKNTLCFEDRGIDRVWSKDLKPPRAHSPPE
ncbi:hypothetical protein FS749_013806 [Ceratobasidium sp. UAMH 11750]|nr:hypothetical protein FS749_013806 [Ceratobasidium sp. UAMH 11750]